LRRLCLHLDGLRRTPPTSSLTSVRAVAPAVNTMLPMTTVRKPCCDTSSL
jgi:hypothetical protein